MNQRYPHSAPVRTGTELAWHEHIDRRVRDVAWSFGAQEIRYPALIASAVLEQAEYPQAFPHLLLSASPWQTADHAGSSAQPSMQGASEWCLSPAVCHHVFAHLAGSTLLEPQVLTASGTCFRHERERAPGVRQLEFSMREIVLLGSHTWVDESARVIAEAIESLARDLGLEGDWCAATDPFFLPAARGKAALQRLTKVKLEYQLRGQGLALASVNRHGTFFGDRFHITSADGESLDSACIAVGLDRWSHAARPASGAVRTASPMKEVHS
jgi:hypothetical protein